ncbi:unnamed protein product [Microthlaspi erraticum]|uniref:Uncharacterized protein n=1 Tax=Microthlaspi erraticum TaxID=1685480 RepID=A0A6D2IBM1_9BRAS|nr:unnamed protein product [Microthlaspi erraticum]
MNTRNPENLDREDLDLTINLKRSDLIRSLLGNNSAIKSRKVNCTRDFYPVFVSYSLGEGFAPSYAIHYTTERVPAITEIPMYRKPRDQAYK